MVKLVSLSEFVNKNETKFQEENKDFNKKTGLYKNSVKSLNFKLNDWLFFLLTISCVNSIYYIISSYFFSVSIDYRYLLTNNLATFLIFFLFFLLTKNIGPESLNQILSVLSL